MIRNIYVIIYIKYENYFCNDVPVVCTLASLTQNGQLLGGWGRGWEAGHMISIVSGSQIRYLEMFPSRELMTHHPSLSGHLVILGEFCSSPFFYSGSLGLSCCRRHLAGGRKNGMN